MTRATHVPYSRRERLQSIALPNRSKTKATVKTYRAYRSAGVVLITIEFGRDSLRFDLKFSASSVTI